MKSKKKVFKVFGALLAVMMLVSVLAPSILAQETEDSSLVSSSEIPTSTVSASLQEDSAQLEPSSSVEPGSEEEISVPEEPKPQSEEEITPEVVEPAVMLVDAENVYAGTPFGVKISGLTTAASLILPENIEFLEGYGATANEDGTAIGLSPAADGSDILLSLSSKAKGDYALTVQDSEGQTIAEVAFNVQSPQRQGRSVTDADSSLTLKVGDGVSGFVDVDSIGNQIGWPLTTTTKQMQITANFGPTGTVKDRIIEVDIPRGYKVLEYSAKANTPVISGVNKLAFSTEDETKVETSVLTATDGSPWNTQGINGYTSGNSSTEKLQRTYDGKVLYHFTPNCGEIVLTLTLGLDHVIMPHNSNTLLLGTINVALKNGTNTPLVKTVRAEVSGVSITAFARGANSFSSRAVAGEIDILDPNKGFAKDVRTDYYLGSYLNITQNHLAEEFQYVIAYPAGASFTGFSEGILRTPLTSIDPDTFTSNTYGNGHLQVSLDKNARTVTFTFTNVTIIHSTYVSLYWDIEVDNNNVKWNDTIDFTPSFREKAGLSVGIDGTIGNSSAALSITMKKPSVEVTLKGYNRTRYDLNAYADQQYPYDYMIGQFLVANKGPSEAKNLVYDFVFPASPKIRGVSLPGMAGDDYSQIKAVTNAGREITLGNFTVTNVSLSSPGLTIDSADLGLLPEEYLVSLKAYQTVFSVASPALSYTTSSISYYGRFINGQEGDVKLSIYDATNPDSPTLMVSATDHTKIGKTNFMAGDSSLTATPFTPADGTNLGTFYPNSTIVMTTVYTPISNVASQNDGIDPTVTITLPEGMELDTASVLGKSISGNHGADSFELKPLGVTTTMKNGLNWKVYTYTVYNKLDFVAKANNYFSSSIDPAGYNTISVTYNVKVSSACPTYTGLNASDFFMWDFGSGAAGFQKSPTSARGINIVQKPGLTVRLGIRTEDSGTSYYTYNGQASTIAPITPNAPAEIWLAYENTDSTTFKAGTEIYLPIPKKGHAYSGIFNNTEITDPYTSTTNKAPQWDSFLTEEITLPGFTTYYTTDASYAINSGTKDNSWTPDSGYSWTSTPANLSNVTMVKFVANADIPSGDKNETTFKVSVANDANLGTQNFWRSYQKGWRDTAGTGTWMYGSILAAEPSMNGIDGMLFLDKNANGIKDTGEDFTNTGGTQVTAVLTGTSISPLTITMNPDGTFQTKNANGTQYFLKTGTYTIQFANRTNSVYGFSPTTPNQRSSATEWDMDIAQNKITSDQASATFTFVVNSTMYTSMTQYVGLGLIKSPIVTYRAGTGATFAQSSESVIYGRTPKNNPNIYSNYAAGYNPDSVVWVLNQDVTLGSNPAVISAGTELTTAQLRTVNVNADVTATANLKAAQYTITYTMDGGTKGTGSPESYGITDTFPIAVPAPQKANFTFEGWTVDYADSSLTDITTPTTSYSIPATATGNITLTAHWAEDTYTVTYHGNGSTSGTEPTDSGTYTTGQSATVLGQGSLTRDNYTFIGWATSSTAAAAQYQGNDTLAISGNVDLYAVWALNTYTVTYHGNGSTSGTEPADSGTYTTDQNATVLGQGSLIRDNYTFSGWATSSTATAAQYQENDTLTISGNIDLYAVWMLNQYTVKFYSNDGSQTEYAANRLNNVPYNTSITAPSTAPTRTGYLFAGWYTSQVGINPGNTDKWDFTSEKVTDNLDLYAGWNSYNYTVIYRLNDGTSNVYNTKSVVSPAGNVGGLPADPQRSGYTFAGWYTTAAQTGGTQFTAATPVTGDVTVYARWNDASVPSDVLSGKGIVLYADEVAGMTRASYLERGLSSAKRTLNGNVSDIAISDITVDFSNVEAQVGSYTVTFTSQYNGLATITVRVIARTYDVIYKFNNGAADGTATSVAGVLVHNPGIPTKDNFTFDGWFNGDKKWDFSNDLMPSHNLVLEAKWSPVPTSSSSEAPTPIPSTSVIPSSSSSRTSSSSVVPDSSSAPVSSSNGSSSLANSSNGSASRSDSGGTISSSDSNGDGTVETTISSGGIPLGGVTMQGAWSLLNLILSAICIFLLAIMLMMYFGKHYTWRKSLALLNLLLAIGTVILFFLTTDFKQPLVFINNLTLLFVFLTLVQSVVLYIYLKENKKQEEKQEKASN